MTPEQRALLGKAKKSISAADLLNDPRAYYAMLYGAQALLLQKSLSFSKHSAVIAAFGREFAKSGEVPAELHRFLIEASDSRKVSDYDIAGGIEEQIAQIHIDRARQFLEAIRTLLA